jgi:hypothetical protein
LDANLRENFIDAVDITRVLCQQISEALDEIDPEWRIVCERFALATRRFQSGLLQHIGSHTQKSDRRQ